MGTVASSTSSQEFIKENFKTNIATKINTRLEAAVNARNNVNISNISNSAINITATQEASVRMIIAMYDIQQDSLFMSNEGIDERVMALAQMAEGFKADETSSDMLKDITKNHSTEKLMEVNKIVVAVIAASNNINVSNVTKSSIVLDIAQQANSIGEIYYTALVKSGMEDVAKHMSKSKESIEKKSTDIGGALNGMLKYAWIIGAIILAYFVYIKFLKKERFETLNDMFKHIENI